MVIRNTRTLVRLKEELKGKADFDLAFYDVL